MAEELPPIDDSAPQGKIRVHALGRLLGVTSRQVLTKLSEFGVTVRGPQSSIDETVATQVREALANAEPASNADTGAKAEPPAKAQQEQKAQERAEPEAAPQEQAPEGAGSTQPDPAPAQLELVGGPPLFLEPHRLEPHLVEPHLVEPRKADPQAAEASDSDEEEENEGESGDDAESRASRRRRRGRRGRGRGRGSEAQEQGEEGGEPVEAELADKPEKAEKPEKADKTDKADKADESGPAAESAEAAELSSSAKRRRRRRRGGDGADDDAPPAPTRERSSRSKDKDEVQGISGSTRLEAKRQRRREGRDWGRRRSVILSESEFLARREAVERVMVVRERDGNPDGSPGGKYTQIGVLEDNVLVEHFVTTSASASMVGNIYLGRVQNVLPSMEAAFVDIGRGNNAVLYAGEVNWEGVGLGGDARKIEHAIKPGDYLLVQVNKDPVGHKGARLTTQIALAGRYLVFVPGASAKGISRKLPDTERNRLREILSGIVPEDAGVIVRTASEGVSAEQLTEDVTRLAEQWQRIQQFAEEAKAQGGGPRSLYREPDLLVKLIRDVFNEDFTKLVVQGENSHEVVQEYLSAIAPDLGARLERFEPKTDGQDVFSEYRVDEQLAKALGRKVWLPSGGTLVIDRTEAMTVVDVNTGKFVGSGGNLEETVTRNNLEAAEEIVRQLRLRDIGGIIVVDFIDMVLESNRELVLRRLTECLARDRTRHQVSEVTSLGLVQMTRKRIGTGLLEAFSTKCSHCEGRGVVVHSDPLGTEPSDEGRAESGSGRGRRSRGGSGGSSGGNAQQQAPVVPKVVAHHGEHPMFRAMAAQAEATQGEEAPA
ncbi:MAG: translation initiation factor IF-2 N-terminal domain-containing protein [Segniliparus sp.]|uniref:translation initiation factor IF-2 N-terminal domain-containing protein n=1 Tax=Segniliparus sp. TaxID=2804064 RepID=UPI003F2EC2FB